MSFTEYSAVGFRGALPFSLFGAPLADFRIRALGLPMVIDQDA